MVTSSSFDRAARAACARRPVAPVKEDRQEMAKTTRKTDPTAAEKKPAARRTKAAPAAGAGKSSPRRRTKAGAEAAGVEEPAAIGAAQAEPRAAVTEPAHDEIALRAWAIYERRGSSHGDAYRDWLQALEELRRERGLAD